MGARSITEKQIKAAIKKSLGAAGRKYNLDETHVNYVIGTNGPGGARAAGVPIADRHEAHRPVSAVAWLGQAIMRAGGHEP